MNGDLAAMRNDIGKILSHTVPIPMPASYRPYPLLTPYLLVTD